VENDARKQLLLAANEVQVVSLRHENRQWEYHVRLAVVLGLCMSGSCIFIPGAQQRLNIASSESALRSKLRANSKGTARSKLGQVEHAMSQLINVRSTVRIRSYFDFESGSST
jgi:hypothetical protein